MVPLDSEKALLIRASMPSSPCTKRARRLPEALLGRRLCGTAAIDQPHECDGDAWGISSSASQSDNAGSSSFCSSKSPASHTSQRSGRLINTPVALPSVLPDTVEGSLPAELRTALRGAAPPGCDPEVVLSGGKYRKIRDVAWPLPIGHYRRDRRPRGELAMLGSQLLILVSASNLGHSLKVALEEAPLVDGEHCLQVSPFLSEMVNRARALIANYLGSEVRELFRKDDHQAFYMDAISGMAKACGDLDASSPSDAIRIPYWLEVGRHVKTGPINTALKSAPQSARPYCCQHSAFSKVP